MSFKYLSVVILIAARALAEENPGMILAVHKSQFLPLFAQALPSINAYMDRQTIDVNYVDGFMTLLKFDFHVDAVTKDQCLFEPGTEPSSVHVQLSKISQKVVSYVSIDAVVLTSNGTVTSQGVINTVDFLLTAKDFTPEMKGKPYFNFKILNVTFDVDSFTLTADLPYVPDFLINTLLSMFKSSVLETIKDSIMHIINDNGHEIFDQIINDYYPNFVQLEGFPMVLSSRLVSKPFFKFNELYLYVDGTFYNPDQGYTYPTDIREIDLISDPAFFVDLYLSEYSLKTYMKVLFDKNMTSVGSLFNWTLESVVEKEHVDIKDTATVIEIIPQIW